MPIVSFNESDFKARYPSLTLEAGPFLQSCFERAEGFVANTEESIVADSTERRSILYLATAHIAMLEKRGALAVGQLNSASQGSVSVGYEGLGDPIGSGAWWQQTQYGAEYWSRTAKYRSFRYIPAPSRR